MDSDDKKLEIGEYFEQFISRQVETGRFSSDTDVLMAGLRLLEEQQLRTKLRKSDLEQTLTDLRENLDETTLTQSDASQSATETMRALASAAAEQEKAIPAIPKTKGLLRSQIAAE